ncbi:MAG: DUF5721 family protein [Anaerotignaceae bacterium]
MIVAEVLNIKDFMAMLLKKDTFDTLEVREVTVTTFSTFQIYGNINKEYFDESQPIAQYATWERLKSYVFEIIKGNKQPKHIKIIFSASDELLTSVSAEASALFINIQFENGKATIISGCSQKTFSLDKKLENIWDMWVTEFFSNNNINVEILE